VDVVALVQDLFGPRATLCDPLGLGRGDERRSTAGWDHNVDSAADEVE
jgi:hypothetical protein